MGASHDALSQVMLRELRAGPAAAEPIAQGQRRSR